MCFFADIGMFKAVFDSQTAVFASFFAPIRQRKGEFSVRKMKKALAFLKSLCYNITRRLGVAQIGSALPWGGRGRKFESCHSDHIAACFYERFLYWGVAKW